MTSGEAPSKSRSYHQFLSLNLLGRQARATQRLGKVLRKATVNEAPQLRTYVHRPPTVQRMEPEQDAKRSNPPQGQKIPTLQLLRRRISKQGSLAKLIA